MHFSEVSAVGVHTCSGRYAGDENGQSTHRISNNPFLFGPLSGWVGPDGLCGRSIASARIDDTGTAFVRLGLAGVENQLCSSAARVKRNDGEAGMTYITLIFD